MFTVQTVFLFFIRLGYFDFIDFSTSSMYLYISISISIYDLSIYLLGPGLDHIQDLQIRGAFGAF